jgi:hypothetical protein
MKTKMRGSAKLAIGQFPAALSAALFAGGTQISPAKLRCETLTTKQLIAKMSPAARKLPEALELMPVIMPNGGGFSFMLFS